jgi:hypothetical protein
MGRPWTERAREVPTPGTDLSWSAVALVASCFLVLALTANLLVPPFDGPDEHSHFQYARLLAQGKGIPVETDPERSAGTEGLGPPLYYALPAMILAALDPERGAACRHIGAVSFQTIFEMASTPGLPPMNPRWLGFGRGNDPNLFAHPAGGPLAGGPMRVIHCMRLFSTLCGLATLVALFLLAREVAPGRPHVQMLGLAVVAFNPQFVYLTGLLNNDNLVTVFATLVLWRTMHVFRKEHPPGRTDALVLGVSMGLGLLTKVSIMFLIVPIVAVVWLRSPSVGAFARTMGLMGTVVVGIAGWFYVRNAWLYGRLVLVHPAFMVPPEQVVRALVLLLPLLFVSFWGRFGWLTVGLPWWQYLFYGLLGAMSLATLVPTRGTRGSAVMRPQVLLWATVAANFISLFALNFTFSGNQGRLLFPSIGASALLIALGVERVSAALWSGAARISAMAVTIALLVSVLFVQWGVIFPVYFR